MRTGNIFQGFESEGPGKIIKGSEWDTRSDSEKINVVYKVECLMGDSK